MSLNWVTISIILVLPLVYFIVEMQKNRKNKTEKNTQLNRKELLDAILKNNKDRYEA